ncbi:MAG: DMT family transporter [Eubacteriales bacterium]|nr:DMT family transporter [Eubacteriales bacterium]
MKQNSKLRSDLLLFLAAFVWGIAFVAQEEGAKILQPFTFNAIRMTIGGLVLIPFVFALNGRKRAQKEEGSAKTLLLGGILCGTALCIASALQQTGLGYTSASKAGFITALYMVVVPILGLFLKKKVRPVVWVAVMLSCVGMYMLCVTDGFTEINIGDIVVMLSSFFYATQILLIDYFVEKVDPVKLSCVQFFAVGIFSAIPALLIEHPPIENILAAWGPLLYTGVFSCGIAYTCQMIGQKGATPAVAALIMSLESVFAAIAGVILLPASNTLSATQLIGCVLMFGAIVLTQVPIKIKR